MQEQRKRAFGGSWEPWEDELIKAHYQRVGPTVIAAFLQRGVGRVHREAVRLGVADGDPPDPYRGVLDMLHEARIELADANRSTRDHYEHPEKYARPGNLLAETIKAVREHITVPKIVNLHDEEES